MAYGKCEGVEEGGVCWEWEGEAGRVHHRKYIPEFVEHVYCNCYMLSVHSNIHWHVSVAIQDKKTVQIS